MNTNDSGLTIEQGKYILNGVDVSAIVKQIEPGFIAVMGRVGRKNFHAYFGLRENGSWGAFDGVTAVLSVNQKPQLQQWAADLSALTALKEKYPDLEAEYTLAKAIEDWKTRAKALDALDEKYPAYYEARTAHIQKRDKAGVQGTDTHAQVEEYVKKCIAVNAGLPIHPAESQEDYSKALRSFIEWAINNQVKFIASERRMYSREWWVAGTTDLVFEQEGKRYVGDVKTHKKLWDNGPFIQCAAYAKMMAEHGERFDGTCILSIPKETNTVEASYRYDLAGDIGAFEGALTFYRTL